MEINQVWPEKVFFYGEESNYKKGWLYFDVRYFRDLSTSA